MKFIPDSIARKVAQQSLSAREHSPEILFGVGVVGMISSTVLACRATLKLDEVLNEIEHNKIVAHDTKTDLEAAAAAGEPKTNVKGEVLTYSESELKRDITIITVRGFGNIVKLYAPAVLVGAASVFCLTKSHNILQERNLALTAAYAAVDGAYNRYRQRVVDRYGEEADREILYESELVEVIDDETGEVVTTMRVTDAPGSKYAREYAEWSSKNWSPHPESNLIFLRAVQNYCNDLLRSRGHLFLNEAYTELGLEHTKAGAVVGWRWRAGSGDDCVDFGIWDGNKEADDFFRGREDSVMLDFNVDGLIWDKLDEGGIS